MKRFALVINFLHEPRARSPFGGGRFFQFGQVPGAAMACGFRRRGASVKQNQTRKQEKTFLHGSMLGSGCSAATTPPRAAAEKLARIARFAAGVCAARRGATRRSATSATTLNRYLHRRKDWMRKARFMGSFHETSRAEPLHRSSRGEEALTLCAKAGMILLTSAATRFMERSRISIRR